MKRNAVWTGALPLVAAAAAFAYPGLAAAARGPAHPAGYSTPARAVACRSAFDRGKGWEVVLARTRKAGVAVSLRTRAETKGLEATIEKNHCGAYQVALKDVRSHAQALRLDAKARRDGFRATVVRS